ncbi:MAG: LytTR family DNA-binding domain-containing protein [Ruminococcus sp.]|nr:LytTR family DNA-binding domain-containing protein [Ruminococcus sp.]MCM1382712.1 LytTR family DNA-binding domain-containing protein [Muribaculaceae bacterium]MCM1480843.1 LytTR family DNA-binding domain-containing protein [Muribaculaceae bacterium]
MIFTVNIAVCEDNPLDMERLRGLLTDVGGGRFAVAEYGSAEELLWDIETERRHFDIFLLDIYLEKMSGVDAARRIRAENENAPVIFISSSEDFYREAFDVYAFHYLVKPFDRETAAAVLKKAVKAVERDIDETLPIVYKGKHTMLKYADIAYISSMNHHLQYHMRDGGEYISYDKLDEIADKIKSEMFVRCHKSFIVNIANVKELTVEGFITDSGIVPISRTYSAAARESYSKRLFGIFQDN